VYAKLTSRLLALSLEGFTLSSEGLAQSLGGPLSRPNFRLAAVCTHSQKRTFVSLLFATLTDSAICKSFPCHSYENCREAYPKANFRRKSLVPSKQSLKWPQILKFRAIDFQLSTACPEPRGVDFPLSPLDLTLTRNSPVNPLFLTLTKCKDLKSHRITLLQKKWGEGRSVSEVREMKVRSCSGRSSDRPGASEQPTEMNSLIRSKAHYIVGENQV
jgi:hypothetical protein